MSYKIDNFETNDDVKILKEVGPFKIIEYQKDLSIHPSYAETAYFCAQMGVKKRQVICDVSQSNITTQRGAMQWTVGNVNATSGVKGAGDFIKKSLRGSVTGESAVKPEYTGDGILVLEPTFRHILLVNPASFGNKMVIDDGLFLACQSNIQQSAVMRKNFSSAALGGEGLFNLALSGNGIVVLESTVPQEELIMIQLDNDVVKIDGPYAIAWSDSLDFTVEKSGKSLIGSAASGEGLVNVYRGTGTILLSPVANNIKFGAGSETKFG